MAHTKQFFFALAAFISFLADAGLQHPNISHQLAYKNLNNPKVEILDFNVSRDLNAVKQIAKEGWSTLSTIPQYDEIHIQRLFEDSNSYNRPGQKNIIKVIQVDDKTAGFMIFSPGNRAMVELLAVGSQFRNKGLGYKLLSTAQELAQKYNSQGLELYVFNDNIPAIKLYEKFGFAKSHDVFEDISLMVKPLKVKQEFVCGTCEKYRNALTALKLI